MFAKECKELATLSIGVDLGGTSLRVGIFSLVQTPRDGKAIDPELTLLDSRKVVTRVADGPEAMIEDTAILVEELIAKYGASGQVLGIGLGSPGPLNLRLGTLGSLPNFPGWDGFPLRDALEARTKLPVHLECDANAAALAEWKCGSGKGEDLDTMVMITLGTGVGSGLVLNRKMWHGMVGMGGEVGHVSVDPNGLPCGCGTRGCLEMYASANGVIRLALLAAERPEASNALRSLTQSSFTPFDVATLAANGDASAAWVFERVGFYLGLGLATLVNTLDPAMIVIGGGVAEAWDLFAPQMFRTLREYSYVYRAAEPRNLQTRELERICVRPALLGPGAGLLGAALLPLLATDHAAPATVETISNELL